MLSSVYVGLVVTSNNLGATCIAEFSDVTAPGATGAWQVADIGGSIPGNDADTFYVALEDNLGRVGLATHLDAVTTPEWLQWNIPLTEFAPANPAAVKKMYIGVGNRNAPMADGAGMVLVDDVRVTAP